MIQLLETYSIPYARRHIRQIRAKSSAKNGEAELSAGIANLRAEFAELLLRMEEGELQKDLFVREVCTMHEINRPSPDP